MSDTDVVIQLKSPQLYGKRVNITRAYNTACQLCAGIRTTMAARQELRDLVEDMLERLNLSHTGAIGYSKEK